MRHLSRRRRAVAAAVGPDRQIDRAVVTVAGVGIAALGTAAIGQAGLRQGVLVLLGVLLGITLYHAKFGFVGGWRAFQVSRNAAGLRAQMLAVGLASLLIMPLLSLETVGGQPVTGAYGPVGLSLVIGAALFGFGMQLGGGCGSGTLFTAGGGDTRMMVTLLFFILGALIGTAHLPWWMALPDIGPVGLQDSLGLWPAIVLQLAVLAGIAAAATWVERRAGAARPAVPYRLLTGPWPLPAAAVLLALLNALTLVTAGHPWSITFAFGLWGAKLLSAAGVAVESWTFWTWPGPAAALANPVLADTISVMDFGLVLGALLAAGLAGRFAPEWRIPRRALAAAVIGGLAMGYGARLAFGCNIGAFFSGIASGSLHGWIWFALAFLGSLAGVRARPWFGLPNR